MILHIFAGVALLTLLLAAVTAVGALAIASRHPPTGRFVETDGARLHVLELGPSGDAPPVVLLHGASANLQDMRLTLGERLAARHRVILIDRPGHGWSGRPDGDDAASSTRQAALIAQALDRLGVARAIVVGHSFAGAVVTAFALDHPQRVAGMVLLAPVTHPWPGGIAVQHVAADLVVAEIDRLAAQ
jgi:pimeloyl-ACP methyl ester carboxylesterase